jgi:hypothetical protein
MKIIRTHYKRRALGMWAMAVPGKSSVVLNPRDMQVQTLKEWLDFAKILPSVVPDAFKRDLAKELLDRTLEQDWLEVEAHWSDMMTQHYPPTRGD